MAATATTTHRGSEEYHHPSPVATWWRQDSPGTYFWRCLVPARRLPGQVLRFVPRYDIGADENGDIVWGRQQGTAIWQFPGNATTGTLMAGMQADGIRVLVEVDDSYLHLPDAGLHGGWQAELDRSGQTDRFSLEAHERLCRFADGLIVSTPELADLYGEINENIWVCPNSVEPDDWPDVGQSEDGVLRIGWGASHSHVVDAPLVRRALRWAADQPNVEVWVFGIGDVYKFPGAVRKAPWTDNLTDYRASLGRCDVMICPLIETPWSRYKSDLKALEACMAGAWPIVSTASPYRPWQDRTLTCTTAKDWEQAIRWAVRHRDEIPALMAETRDYVLSERTIDSNIHLWREALNG
jgi:hypothetical protein